MDDLDGVLAVEGLGLRGIGLGVVLGGAGLIDEVIAGVLDVAPGLAGGAFKLVFLAGDFDALIAEKRAGGLLDATADFLGAC